MDAFGEFAATILFKNGIGQGIAAWIIILVFAVLAWYVMIYRGDEE